MRSKLVWRPTEISDAAKLYRTWDIDEPNLLTGVPTAVRKGQELLTVLDPETDEVLAIAGISHLWAGVAEIWVILSNEARRHPLRTVRAAREVIAHWEWTHSLHRVQATGKLDDRIPRWMASVGFQFEGVLRAFGAKGEDYGVYSRIKNYGR